MSDTTPEDRKPTPETTPAAVPVEFRSDLLDDRMQERTDLAQNAPEVPAAAATVSETHRESMNAPVDRDAPLDTGARVDTGSGDSDATRVLPTHVGQEDHGDSAAGTRRAAAEATAAPTAASEATASTSSPAADAGTADAEESGVLPSANPPRDYPVYAQQSPTPIYVQAPVPPRAKGNRGAGILIALLATVVYAALFALVVFVIAAVNSASAAGAMTTFSEFVARPVFYVPVIFFFLAFVLLVALINRGGWWAYVLFGFLVAVVVYFSYIGGALLTVQAWTLTPAEAGRFVSTVWLNPAAIAAAVIAREVPIWAGAWIARRGRKVTDRNAAARREYDRLLAEGPQLARSA
jgi:hypothetical protein